MNQTSCESHDRPHYNICLSRYSHKDGQRKYCKNCSKQCYHSKVLLLSCQDDQETIETLISKIEEQKQKLKLILKENQEKYNQIQSQFQNLIKQLELIEQLLPYDQSYSIKIFGLSITEIKFIIIIQQYNCLLIYI
ncbi:hypothetical protein pb186bvf_020430 [Paramecium bursaria]